MIRILVEKLLHIATAFLFLLSYRPTRVCQWHFFRSLHVFIRRFASAGEKRKKPPVLFTAERHRGLLSHRDPAEGVGDGAQEDDGGEEGAEEADHGVEDLLAAERGLAKQDLLLDPADADDAGDQQADGDGRDGHHDGIRQEIEEIKELHPDDRHACQRAVAERRERAERQHDDADNGRGRLPAPAELVLEGRDGAFRQRDRAGQRGEEHEDEEQNADGRAEAHGVEDLGDGDEHQ